MKSNPFLLPASVQGIEGAREQHHVLRTAGVQAIMRQKGRENVKDPAPARREGRVAFLATLRLLCCSSAAQGGRRANAPPERDGRVALLATLKLLCGGGLEGATAAPLLLRRGRQSYSAPYCLGEASRFTSFSKSAAAPRQALGTCDH